MSPAPDETGRPGSALHWLRILERAGEAELVAGFEGFGFGQPAAGELRGPAFGGEIPEAGRPGIDCAGLDDPTILAGFGAVEAAGFELEAAPGDARGDDVVGDVGGILQVMGKRGL